MNLFYGTDALFLEHVNIFKITDKLFLHRLQYCFALAKKVLTAQQRFRYCKKKFTNVKSVHFIFQKVFLVWNKYACVPTKKKHNVLSFHALQQSVNFIFSSLFLVLILFLFLEFFFISIYNLYIFKFFIFSTFFCYHYYFYSCTLKMFRLYLKNAIICFRNIHHAFEKFHSTNTKLLVVYCFKNHR